MRTLIWLLEIVASIVFFLVLAAAILPWLLSIDASRSALLAFVKNVTGKEIVVKEVSLHWFGPQCVKGLYFRDDTRHLRLCSEEITTEASLWQMLVTSHDIGDVQILDPYLVIETPASPPAISLLKPPPLQIASLSPPPLSDLCSLGGRAARLFSGQIHLERGTIEIADPQIDPIFFNGISASAKLPKSEPGKNATESLEFQFQGTTMTTSQNPSTKAVEGNFHFTGTLTPCGGKETILALQGTATQLPVTGLDQVVSLVMPHTRGMLIAALGSTLNLTTSVLLCQESGECAIEISSPRATASLFATTQNGHIILRQPATCAITLTPELVQFLFATSPYFRTLSLSSSSKLQLSLSNLSIPFGERGIDWLALTAEAELHLDQVELKSLGLSQKVRLSGLHASSKVGQLHKSMLIDLGAELYYGDLSSTFYSVVQITGPLEDPKLQTFTLSADNFPVAVLDELLIKEDLTAILGHMFNLRIGVERTHDNPIATVYFSTPNLAIPGAFINLTGGYHLQEPCTITFAPSEEWQKSYMPGISMRAVDIAVQDFDMDSSGSLITTHLQMKAEAIQIHNYALTKPQLNVDVEGWNHLAFALQAQGLNGAWTMNYEPDRQRLSTQQPIEIKATLLPELWGAPSSAPSQIELVQPVDITFGVSPFILRTGHGMFSSLALDGTLHIKECILRRKGMLESRFALSNMAGKWKFDQPRGEFAASLAGQVAGSSNTPSEVSVEGLLRRSAAAASPKSDNAASHFEVIGKCQAEKLDTTALDVWLENFSSLKPLIGPFLSLKLDAEHNPLKSALSLNIKSDRVNLNCGIARERNQLLLRSSSSPITCNVNLSPEGYAIIAGLWQQTYGKPIPLNLAKPSEVALRIDTLNVPVVEGSFTPVPDALMSALFSGNLMIPRLPLSDAVTGRLLTFQQVAMQIQRKSQELPLEATFKSTIEAERPGLIDVRGSIAALTPNRNSSEGGLNPVRICMDANFQDVPASLPDLTVTLIGFGPGMLSAILGPSVTGSLHTDLTAGNGPLTLQINTPFTRLSLKGRLMGGILTLEESLLAEITLSESLSHTFLQKTNPLSLDIVTSEGPMTLTVEKEGFSFPLFPWNINAAMVPHARIDLGKITCHNKGNLSSMLGLLKLAQFSREKDLKLWFAPLDLSLKSGIVDCDRTEILLDNLLDIATWGKIDLNRSRVDAVLGIPASALETAFGLKGLPEDYVLQLPMKGPIGDVQIDTSKATAKIALLLAWKQGTSGAGGILGGPQGAAIGGLLGKLAQLPDAKNPAPPAKHPFPWESQQSQPKPPPKSRKSAFKRGDKPLKQLLRLIR